MFRIDGVERRAAQLNFSGNTGTLETLFLCAFCLARGNEQARHIYEETTARRLSVELD